MASFNEGEKHDFDLELILAALKRCPTPEDDVNLKEYLVAYHELCRFFRLTGRLFGFVAADLEGKITSIEKKQRSPAHGNHYATVKGMFQFEVNTSEHVNNIPRSSGTRTLLRLHWALEFILEFMSRLYHSNDNDRASTIAAEVYEQTLSKHHPWLTRKMAALAMYFLPSRKVLISVMCKHDYNHALSLLDSIVQAGRMVYNITQKYYSDNNMMHIP